MKPSKDYIKEYERGLNWACVWWSIAMLDEGISRDKIEKEIDKFLEDTKELIKHLKKDLENEQI